MDVFEIAEQFRRELDRRRSAAGAALLKAYAQSWDRISQELDRLIQKIEIAQAKGEPITPGWIYQQQRLESLLEQTAAEITRLSNFAAAATKREQQAVIKLAQQRAAAIARAGSREQGLDVAFTRLPQEALAKFVGLMADGSALKDSFQKLAKDMNVDAAEAIKQAITQGIALGYNPNKIASLIRQELEARSGNRYKDPAIIRRLRLATHSSVMWSYRESSREVLEENSHLFKGWRWLSARNPYTCPACWALDGKFFPLTEPQGAHLQCRCTMLPVMKGDTDAVETGESRFSQLSPGQQKATLGPAKFNAYSSGDLLLLEDLVAKRKSAEWGTQRGTGSLADAIGNDLAKHYLSGKTHPTFDGTLYRAERQMVDRKYEVTLLYNEKDEIIFRKKGTGHDIAFTKTESLILKKGATITHTHPFGGEGEDGGTFSASDVLSAAQSGITRLRAVTRDKNGRTVMYMLEVDRWPAPAKLSMSLQLWLQRAQERLQLSQSFESLSLAEKSQVFHLAWQLITSSFNRSGFHLIYQRTAL